MMKRIIVGILLLGLSVMARAQHSSVFFQDSVQKLSFSADAAIFYGSSVMNNDFMNKFIYGGEIDRSIKDNAYNNLNKDNNRIGGDVQLNFIANIPIDSLFKKTTICKSKR